MDWLWIFTLSPIVPFLFPFGFPILYYWIALDEMKGQHSVRRAVWLVFVPLCIATVVISMSLSLLPMMFFIALGEAFDKPKPEITPARVDRKFLTKYAITTVLILFIFVNPLITMLGFAAWWIVWFIRTTLHRKPSNPQN